MSDEWLPELLLFKDSNGVWSDYLEKLHQQFILDFVHSVPQWENKRVALKRHPEYDGKSATFWHMISTGDDEAERTPDFRRCERIAWVRCMMDHFSETPHGVASQVVWWKEKRGAKEWRYVLSLSDFSYMVIVADRGNYVLPWTAYYVEHEHQRKRYKKKWQEFWKP
ncbi:hypothetical protein [Alkanindiges illinoisensis]|uniref:Uncharacterized protein n=1 Tax=Alkanindiges illinoisensis TaxID=197183 RepID=A0A4Y7XF68_9GAMM|nr:hypothetical protein [Alkanindiges illinoisensis]TEU30458.1 hypothetical protein E2B99_02030 [Alkanindiges illinoisensis]